MDTTYSKEDIGVGMTFQNSIGVPCYIVLEPEKDYFVVDVGDEHTVGMRRDYMWEMMEKGRYTIISKEDTYEIF